MSITCSRSAWDALRRLRPAAATAIWSSGPAVIGASPTSTVQRILARRALWWPAPQPRRKARGVQQREHRPCFAPGSAPESPAFVLPALSSPTSVLLLAGPRLLTGLMSRALGVARAPRGLDARRPAWCDGQQAAWRDRRRRGP